MNYEKETDEGKVKKKRRNKTSNQANLRLMNKIFIKLGLIVYMNFFYYEYIYLAD